ncbi:phosphate/phosphite/phosphonate ABC transporter substrate-binding protein [Clavibacter michiganensis subsp. phaseoli]|uniref:Phosphate/phosphite/phosphonate ABC transporter substrate-binding protein n=1 Tax=Clavibacter phaseoli TaxID=1734031 RepID=A0A8I0S8H1_9MICO|nr:phosphate/phosphite/phosphonate ABC transporter substrate-binding protein [Clavibacter phaseoli]MBF4630968.1 phosphate/phosphite/phosphonate ABC transporter substrate-binding protein [Clavibacter phaseoli]
MSPSRRTRLGALAASALITALALSGCAAGGSDASSGSAAAASDGTWAKSEGTLVFGAVPDQAGSDSNNKPLEDYIAKETGLAVEYYPTADYTALIAAAVAGKVDLMSSGALQYVMATNKGAEIEPVAATLTSAEVTDPGYYSEAIVPKGSSITDLAGAKGKTVCFVDPNSTSGFLFGLQQLQKAGLGVDSSGTDANGNPTFADFTPYFAGAHDKSAQAVASGQCDVGFAEDSVAEPLAASGQVTVIGKAYVPGGPLSISSTLPADVKAKLTAALQGATPDAIQAAGITLTDGFSKGYFGAQPEDASYYSGIADLCESIPAAKCAK